MIIRIDFQRYDSGAEKLVGKFYFKSIFLPILLNLTPYSPVNNRWKINKL